MGSQVRERILIVLNDPPYGTERSYNGLRLADALAKDSSVALRLFLLGDAVACAKPDQRTPQGYYNLERMITFATRHGAEVGACGSCLDARGIASESLAEGARRSSMEELARWTGWATKVIAF